MPPAHAFTAYRNAEVTTLSQRDLVVRLYQGAERFLVQARTCFANREYEAGDTSCQKAKRIIMELLATLNFEVGGAIAVNLRDLYLFLIGEIVHANLRKDGDRLQRLLPIVATLREGWEQVPEEHANASSLPPGHDGQAFDIRS